MAVLCFALCYDEALLGHPYQAPADVTFSPLHTSVTLGVFSMHALIHQSCKNSMRVMANTMLALGPHLGYLKPTRSWAIGTCRSHIVLWA